MTVAPTTIHVFLLAEGVDVWRPVAASHVAGSRYRLLDQPVPDGEAWQFAPGATVECETRHFDDCSTALCAVKQAAHP